MPDILETGVLVIGGGPVGLGLALDLAWRGCPSLLAERDSGTATVLLAKANGLHERTMELCRRWGIAERVERAGFPTWHPGDSVYCTGLGGYYIGRSFMPSTEERVTPPETPQKRMRCPQYTFDPLLASEVQARGLTKLLYSHNFESLEQDASGVTVKLRRTSDGASVTVRTKFLVGCDGAGSAVRQAVGIDFTGRLLDYSMSAMLRIDDLQSRIDYGRRGERYLLLGKEGAWGIMTSVDGASVWRLTVVGSQEKLNPATYDASADVRRALGDIDAPFEILRVVPWRRSEYAAGAFRSGRVFLAGDSAHTTSPTGGHGMNTGFGDVSDLGWMLEAVLSGWGGPGLLDAYDAERRPVAKRNSASSTANYRGWVANEGYERILEPGANGEAARAAIGAKLQSSLHNEWNSLGIDLGFRYEDSPVIIPDGTPATEDTPDTYIPTARPGHRAPHAWLSDDRSTLDLFGRGFVLLDFAHQTTVAPLEKAAALRRVPLQTIDIADDRIAQLYGFNLVLVRPDGHVAWRGNQLPDDVDRLVDIVRGARPPRVA